MGAKNIEPLDTGADRENYATSRYNAVRHGILSRYAILPWEDRREYDTLLDSLEAEYRPATATESHLVEELAGIMWRMGRVRLAEESVYRKAIASEIGKSVPDYVKGALVTSQTTTDTANGRLDSLADQVTASEAKEAETHLAYWKERQDHFEANELSETMSLLDDEDKKDWQDYRRQIVQRKKEIGYAAPADEEMFVDWLEEYAKHFRGILTKYHHGPAIRQQIIAISYTTERMDGIARYETHLDRKFERVLAMLLKLKEMSRLKGELPPAL